MSVAKVKRLWAAISLPRSHVSDLKSSCGNLRAFLIKALITVSVSLPATFTVLSAGELQPGFEVGLDDAIPQRSLGRRQSAQVTARR